MFAGMLSGLVPKAGGRLIRGLLQNPAAFCSHPFDLFPVLIGCRAIDSRLGRNLHRGPSPGSSRSERSKGLQQSDTQDEHVHKRRLCRVSPFPTIPVNAGPSTRIAFQLFHESVNLMGIDEPLEAEAEIHVEQQGTTQVRLRTPCLTIHRNDHQNGNIFIG